MLALVSADEVHCPYGADSPSRHGRTVLVKAPQEPIAATFFSFPKSPRPGGGLRIFRACFLHGDRKGYSFPRHPHPRFSAFERQCPGACGS